MLLSAVARDCIKVARIGGYWNCAKWKWPSSEWGLRRGMTRWISHGTFVIVTKQKFTVNHQKIFFFDKFPAQHKRWHSWTDRTKQLAVEEQKGQQEQQLPSSDWIVNLSEWHLAANVRNIWRKSQKSTKIQKIIHKNPKNHQKIQKITKKNKKSQKNPKNPKNHQKTPKIPKNPKNPRIFLRI